MDQNYENNGKITDETHVIQTRWLISDLERIIYFFYVSIMRPLDL